MTKILILISLTFTTQAWAQTPTDVVDMTTANKAELEVSEKEKKSEEEKKAEEELAQEKQVVAKKNIEKIEVTGSYIKRIDTEGPSPVITIDKEEFEVAGVDTVSDYLREDPLFSGSDDGDTGSGYRDGYFSFRGQHGGSSLVLLNGMRIPKLGGTGRGFFTSVSNIPTNVIERVEILKDGSSALYGSDAQAGVINFITRKDYDGAEFSTRVNLPEIGAGLQQNHTIAFGKNYTRGNWFATVQYMEQQGYTQADVGNYYTDLNYRPNTTSGNYKIGKNDKVYYQADCLDGDDRCDPDQRGQRFLRDPRQSLGALVSTRFDFNSDLNLSFIGMYNRKVRKDINLPNSLNFGGENGPKLKASQIGAANIKANASDDDIVAMSLYPNDEVGMTDIDVLQNAYTAQSKLEGYFLDSWSWNLAGGYAFTREQRDHRNGLVDLDGVAQALSNGWDPSAIGQNNGALDAAKVQGIEAYEASMTTARLLTTGELFDFTDVWGTGGPMSMAVGVEGQWETTSDDHDNLLIDRTLNQDFLPNQSGSRAVNSVFAELSSYPLESMEVQMAGRYDSYSDFGDTFNPKLSIGVRPSNKVLLRSSIGTTFTAPSVRNMIQRDSLEYSDYAFCPPEDLDCDDSRLEVTRYKDPNLTSETGVNYNFGTVIQPNKKWSFTFDQWNFEGKGTIARLGSAYENVWDAGVRQGGVAGGEAALNNAGVTLIRDPDTNEIIGARMPHVVNRGQLIIRGIDLGFSYDTRVKILGKIMKTNLKSRHSHTIVRKSIEGSGAAPYSYGDLEWKNTTSFALNTRDHSYRLAARSLAGNSGRSYTTDTHTEYDFTYGYTLSWGGRFSAGVKNLVNRKPPTDKTGNFVNFARSRDDYAFQPLGRRYFVGYKQSF